MKDYGVQDNVGVLNLLAEEISRDTDLKSYLEDQPQLNFDIDDFQNSDDKARYLNGLSWNRACLDDIIEIANHVEFTYVLLEDSDALERCYVKDHKIMQFGIDEEGFYTSREYPEYEAFGEYLKELSPEAYGFYVAYVDDKNKMAKEKAEDGFSEYYDEITKAVEEYFNKISDKYDLAIWSQLY